MSFNSLMIFFQFLKKQEGCMALLEGEADGGTNFG